jgi:hypothetical protein
MRLYPFESDLRRGDGRPPLAPPDGAERPAAELLNENVLTDFISRSQHQGMVQCSSEKMQE